MRKKIVAACLTVMLACLLWLVRDRWFLPVVQETEHEGLRMGLSQAEPLMPWKIAQIKNLKEAARRGGAQLIYHTPEGESSEWQIEDIYGLLDSGINYLVLILGAGNGYDQVLLKTGQRGVSVALAGQNVEMESEYDQEDYTLGYATSDHYAKGELCAGILTRHLGIESCHTMVIQGEKSSTTDWKRYMGFVHSVREHSNLYVSRHVESSGNRFTAQEVTESVIVDQDIGFNAVFAQSDKDGLGVLQAPELAGMEPGKDVVIVSIGRVQDVFKVTTAREYLATIRSSPEYGDAIFDITNRYQKGGKPGWRTMVRYREYTMDGVEELFEDACQRNHKGLYE